jgi:hypothetical protein
LPQNQTANQSCPSCQTELRADATHCYHCGHALKRRPSRITGIPALDVVLRIIGGLLLILMLGVFLFCKGCFVIPSG